MNRSRPSRRLRNRRTLTRRSRPAGSSPWKHGTVPVLGLIGGVGSGKSRFAELLAKRGALVIDADRVGHALLDQKPAREAVVKRFGSEVLIEPAADSEPPRVDRAALARIVFSEPNSPALRALEAILHPRMRKTFEKAIARAQRSQRHPLVVLDAAILLEARWDDLCDLVAFMDTPESERLARVASERAWTAETLRARERAQLPLDQKRKRADAVVENSGGADALERHADLLWKRMRLDRNATTHTPPLKSTAPAPPSA